MKTQIPIYRAKKIDSDEYVEGYYLPEAFGKANNYEDRYIQTPHMQVWNIDPSTLSISFNGVDFYSVEEIQVRLDFANAEEERVKKIWGE